MNIKALYITPLIFLLVYGLLATFLLYLAENKLEIAKQEGINLLVEIEIAKHENEKVINEINRQNCMLAELAETMENSEAKYKSELKRLSFEKQKANSYATFRLTKNKSAENQLKLIEEQLKDYLILPEEDRHELIQ